MVDIFGLLLENPILFYINYFYCHITVFCCNLSYIVRQNYQLSMENMQKDILYICNIYLYDFPMINFFRNI